MLHNLRVLGYLQLVRKPGCDFISGCRSKQERRKNYEEHNGVQKPTNSTNLKKLIFENYFFMKVTNFTVARC